MKKTPKRDCTNCGWGVEWTLRFDLHGEGHLGGRCRFQPLPKFYETPCATIGPKTKPATDCPTWKKARQPVPPWGVRTELWEMERLRERAREAWDSLEPEFRKELEAAGMERP